MVRLSRASRLPAEPVHADILDCHLWDKTNQPRNLKAMLSEAKDTSELMVDLAYAACSSVTRAWPTRCTSSRSSCPTSHTSMREVCVLAARSPRDAEEMSSVLHVLSAYRTHGERGSRHRAHRHPPGSASRPRSFCRPRGGGRGVATACGCVRTRPCAPIAREPRSADRGGDARRLSAAARTGDRSRRRRSAVAQRTCSSCAVHPGGSPSCACSRARPSGARPAPTRIPRSPPISTAPSTCSSR